MPTPTGSPETPEPAQRAGSARSGRRRDRTQHDRRHGEDVVSDEPDSQGETLARARGDSRGQRPADHLTHRPRNASRPPLRRRRRVALAWAALSLLAGLLGLLALLSPVAAQSVTLVSNAGQSNDNSWNVSDDRSQPFTTGAAGATLSSVEIISEDDQGDDVAVSLCTVDGSNHPTSDCTVLTAPSSFAAGTLVFTAPDGTTLAATTTYSLLVASPGGDLLKLDTTSSDNEDAGVATGWSIADTSDSATSSTVWTSISTSLRITIKGTITNSAPTVATEIPDQTAMAGTALDYTFPAATFTDADGDTLTYAATLADDTALPSWLSFAPATRTFSGTPTAVETVSVKVTASDGTESVSDTFDIVVSATADTTPPEVDSAELGASTTADNLVITFDENLDQTAVSIGLGSAFSVTADGQLISISLISGFDATVTLRASLSAPAIRQGQTVVVGYTDPTAGDDTVALQDIAGNDVASFTTGMAGVPAVTNNSTSIAPTGAPTITGTAQVGETLTAVTTGIMDANGLTSPTYTYQWIRANGTDADIASANSSTYTLDAADLGKTIKVKVSFTDDTSNAETLTSAATATVTAATVTPVTAALVSNIGKASQGIPLRWGTSILPSHSRPATNDAGYTLTSIELRLDSTNHANTPTVKLYRGSANGTEVAMLSGPAMLDAATLANYTFTPSSAVTLLVSTTYWVVAEGDADWIYTVSTSLKTEPPPRVGASPLKYEFRDASETGAFTPSAQEFPFRSASTARLSAAPPTPPRRWRPRSRTRRRRRARRSATRFRPTRSRMRTATR